MQGNTTTDSHGLKLVHVFDSQENFLYIYVH